MTDIVPLFKALADEKRIQIAALISAKGLSTEEIAAAVGLSPATVSHHLSRLRAAGLAESVRDQYYTVYRFRAQPLLDALASLAKQPQAAHVSDDLAKYDQKILADYMDGGKFKSIPAQRKKRDVLLRFLAGKFETGRAYAEKEVNLIIAEYHDDFATLRRELIMTKLMTRENAVYHRVPDAAAIENGAYRRTDDPT